MDAVKVGQLTNADIYWGDDLCIGRFASFERPKIEYEKVKHAALGMVAEFDAPSRQIKALTGKCEVQYLDVDLLPQAYDPTTAIQITMDAPVDVYGPAGLDLSRGYRLTWHLSIIFAVTGSSAHKLSNDFKGEWEYSCLRFVEKAGNRQVPLREIDIMSQINRVNGRDVWSRY